MIEETSVTRQTAHAKIKRLVEKYQALSARERNALNEQETRLGYILPLFHALGWDTQDTAQMRAEQNIKGKRVDFAFVINGKPRFLLETKAISEDLNRPEYIKQARDYAWNKGVAWAVLSDFEGTRVFNAEWKAADPLYAQVLNFSVLDYLDRFDDLWLLSREAMTTGLLDARAERDFKKTPRTPIIESLFMQLVQARQSLYSDFSAFNLSLFNEARLVDDAVQRMLDRLIFLRTAEDRGIEPDSLRSTLRSAPTGKVSETLARHLRTLGAVYNSQLFASYPTDTFYATDDTLAKIIDGLYLTPSKDAEYNFAAIDADVLGRVYEQYLGEGITEHAKSDAKKKKRKSQGIYYTPTFIVRYIVQQTLGRYLEENGYNASKPVRVLDPASGSGSFLIEAFDVLDRYLARQEGSAQDKQDIRAAMRQHRILEENLYGVDKDEQAVEVARLNLMLKALHDRDKLPMLKHIARGDSLISGTDAELEKYFGAGWENKHAFNWEERFPEAMRAGGFDVVVGNPPYVRIQTLPKEDTVFFDNKYASATSNYDIYVLFVERALELLKPNGVFGMILPKKFMQTAYGEGLRRLVSQKNAVAKIVDFGDAQVFDRVTTYTCLFFLKKAENLQFIFTPTGEWLKEQTTPPEVIPAELKDYAFSATRLSGAPWSFSYGEGRELNEKLAQMPKKLGDIADIFVGLQTSADDVYIMDYIGQQDGNLVLRSKSLRATRQFESQLFHPLVSGTDVQRYGVLQERQYILFPYRIDEDTVELISFKELEAKFPKTGAYLKENKRRLEARESGKAKGPKWYGYLYLKNMRRQGFEKLCVPRLVDKLHAAYDETGTHFLDNVDVGGITLHSEYPALGDWYLLALLNSRLLAWYFPSISVPFRGGWWSANRQFISQLPIRAIDFGNNEDKNRHHTITNLAKRMLKLHKDLQATNELDAERRTELEERIARTDEQIDEAVFDLYELTAEERAVVMNAG